MNLKTKEGLMTLTIEYDGADAITQTFDICDTAYRIRQIYESDPDAPQDYLCNELNKLIVGLGYKPVPAYTTEQFSRVVVDEATRLKNALWATPTFGGSPELCDSSGSTPEA